MQNKLLVSLDSDAFHFAYSHWNWNLLHFALQAIWIELRILKTLKGTYQQIKMKTVFPV